MLIYILFLFAIYDCVKKIRSEIHTFSLLVSIRKVRIRPTTLININK